MYKMQPKTKKILIVACGIVGTIAGLTAIVYGLKTIALVKAYKKTASESTIIDVVNKKAEGLGEEMEDDPDLMKKSFNTGTGIIGDFSDLTDEEIEAFLNEEEDYYNYAALGADDTLPS